MVQSWKGHTVTSHTLLVTQINLVQCDKKTRGVGEDRHLGKPSWMLATILRFILLPNTWPILHLKRRQVLLLLGLSSGSW